MKCFIFLSCNNIEGNVPSGFILSTSISQIKAISCPSLINCSKQRAINNCSLSKYDIQPFNQSLGGDMLFLSCLCQVDALVISKTLIQNSVPKFIFVSGICNRVHRPTRRLQFFPKDLLRCITSFPLLVFGTFLEAHKSCRLIYF